jgi:hypothetical protein
MAEFIKQPQITKRNAQRGEKKHLVLKSSDRVGLVKLQKKSIADIQQIDKAELLANALGLVGMAS